MEKQPTVDSVENIYEIASSDETKIENVVANDIDHVDMQGCFAPIDEPEPKSTSLVLPKQIFLPSRHPH